MACFSNCLVRSVHFVMICVKVTLRRLDQAEDAARAAATGHSSVVPCTLCDATDGQQCKPVILTQGSA
jgi:hypothetical protein